MSRRYRPNDLKFHDRRATDLVLGAQVVPIEVDDPFGLDPGDKIVVMRSLRNDPIARLHSHGQIDDGQYLAGRAFQRDFETAERGPRAIDPSKECVDGGLIPEPITEQQRASARRLAGVYGVIGLDASALIHDVLIHGMSMSQLCYHRGFAGTKYWHEKFGTKFRDALHKLAKFYGFASEDTGIKRIDGGGKSG